MSTQLPSTENAGETGSTNRATRRTDATTSVDAESDRETAIAAEGLTFSYPGVDECALDGVSLSVAEGEVLGVVGAVGAGKTTLCMSLAGFVPSVTGGTFDGELDVGGLDPRERAGSEVAETIGMVFEDYSAQITQVHALDEVTAPLLNRGIEKDRARERAIDLLDTVGLGHLDAAEKRTWELSGGQQQRVAIAATLANDPDVLVFDNATGMLDPEGERDVADLIAELAGEKTLVVVDDADFVADIADGVLVMDDGTVAADGPADEVLRDVGTLDRAGVELPTCLRAAEELGIDNRPLTPDEFDAVVPTPDERGVPGDADERTSGPERGLDSTAEPVVSVEDVGFAYGDGTTALSGVTLDVHAGEVHAVIGGNGAGKTTLTKHLAGLHEPTEGAVEVDGVDTREETATDLAWKVGTAFQDPDEQISEATVRDEIAFPLEKRQYERTGWFSKERQYSDEYVDRRVADACDLVGIEDALLERDPAMLPRGQRRLVTIAEALVLDPPVVLLDEPSPGLDAESRAQIRETIERLAERGKAVIVVDHDMDLVCEVADRVTVLEGGEVAMQGPTRAVFAAEHWDRLAEQHIEPPRAAELARQLDVDALTFDALVDELAEAAPPEAR